MPDHLPPVLTPQMSEHAPTWRAAYSDRTCALMADFCHLAYLPFDVRAAGESEGEGRRKLAETLAGGAFQLCETFDIQHGAGLSQFDTQAFLAVRPDQFAVLAFRGTTSFSDWLTNLNAVRVPVAQVGQVRLHSGFLEAFESVRDAIEAAVEKHVPDDLGLYITGHSLGGALAQIASMTLERDNLAACYTFGSPRVGTEDFDRQVKCPHYRLINNYDVVPTVPPPMYGGYQHCGDPRWLTPKAHGQRALRKDPDPLRSFVTNTLSTLLGVLRRKLPMVEDHMIWNYRAELDAIAELRAPMKPVAAPDEVRIVA